MSRLSLPLYGQLKPHVSFSELKLFDECQWKWALTKVFEVPRPPDRSFHMDFGTAVHAGMERLYDRHYPWSPQACAQYALGVYDSLLATLPADTHLSDLTEAHRFRDLLPNIFRDCLACEELQGITPLKSELRLFEALSRTDGLSMHFKGFIDFIFVKRLKTKSVIYIADFKTCQWGWPASKFQDISITAQVLLYKHFFCRKTGANPRDVSAAFILLKKKPRIISKKGELPVIYDRTVEVAKIGSGPKEVQKALDYLQSSVTKMHTYTYSQNLEVCRRSWKDAETKEPRESRCPYLGTDACQPERAPPAPATPAISDIVSSASSVLADDRI